MRQSKADKYGGILGSKIENVEALQFLTEARKNQSALMSKTEALRKLLKRVDNFSERC